MVTIYYRHDAAIEHDPLATKLEVKGNIDHRDYKHVADLEGEDLNNAWRQMNVVDGDELPTKLKVRSMMVGDVIHRRSDNTTWMCAMVGWEQVHWRWGRKPE